MEEDFSTCFLLGGIVHIRVILVRIINYLSAADTVKVIMRNRIAVITAPARTLNLLNEPLLCEQVQISVNGSQSDLRVFLADTLKNFFGCQMNAL